MSVVGAAVGRFYNAGMNQLKQNWLCYLLCGLLMSLAACQAAERPTPTAVIPPVPTSTVAPLPTGMVTATVRPPSVTPQATPTTQPTMTPVPPSPTPDFPLYEGVPLVREQVGIQLHLHGEDLGELMSHLETLNVGWVKVQVSWKVFQPERERLDEVWFAELDALATAAQENGIQLMVGVAKAPEWSRPTTEMDGPPSDPADFAAFMTLLAQRYQGRVAAYELWNETNLQREWNGAPLNGAALVDFIRAGADAVRAADSEALVLSGAPAPTGINDGVTAVDDRVYFQQMVDAGVAQYVDGFGVHPYGWGNPPDSTAAEPDPIAQSHNDHPSFFFLDTLYDYERILAAAGVDTAVQQLWPTEFGWGSFDQIGQPVPGTEFMNDVDEWRQAEYLLAALEFGQAEGWVGPLMLWNLNFGPLLGTDFSETGYSILRPDGSQRPSYKALAYALKEH